MRTLVMFNLVTLDGYFEGPGHDISWHMVDGEVNRFLHQQTAAAGLLLFGRATYELMAGYWPHDTQDPAMAALMTRLPKVVFSHSLQGVTWANTRLVHDDAVAEVRRLKAEAGGDIFLFGSANLARTLIAADLIDEYRLLLNPLTLGQGMPLFSTALRLRLVETRAFGNGCLLLTYQPAG